MPRLLDLLVDPRTPGAADGGDDQLWQSRAFDLGLIDRFEGRLRLEAAQLAVTSEIGLANAAVDVEFGTGQGGRRSARRRPRSERGCHRAGSWKRRQPGQA